MRRLDGFPNAGTLPVSSHENIVVFLLPVGEVCYDFVFVLLKPFHSFPENIFDVVLSIFVHDSD